ncbi:MAG TPA: MFS transporter [Syntrophobacteraceae bacterium]|nr:MFS transporter [Syntrophobacteraceae bacterium]
MSEKVRVVQSGAGLKGSHVKVAFASLIGTAIEWYDFFLYGTAAAFVFNKLFFPQFDPMVGTIVAFATFGIGFVARPVGGMVFGHFGDRIGRKTMLYLTLLIMGIGTTLVGALPSYQSIGIWAPILLVACRLTQGFALGGEWGGAVLMAVEHAPENRRGFYGSWPQLGAPLGLVLGTLVFGYFSRYPEEQFLSWAWRIPFLLSVVLVAVGLFIRMRIAESPAFERIKQAKIEARMPIIEAIAKHPKNMLLAMGVRFAENGLFYVYATFVFAYATNVLKVPRPMILTAVTIAAAIEVFTIPLYGFISDKVGRRPVYMFGAVFSGVWAFPFFWVMGFKNPWLTALGVTIGLAVGHAAMYGPQASFLSEMFSARVRYSGASLGYQLASIFAGALTPMVSASLLAWYGGVFWPVAIYMMILALITVVSLYLASETYRESIEETYAAPTVKGI